MSHCLYEIVSASRDHVYVRLPAGEIEYVTSLAITARGKLAEVTNGTEVSRVSVGESLLFHSKHFYLFYKVKILIHNTIHKSNASVFSIF